MTRVHKKDLPAKQPEAQAAPRLPLAHVDQERPEGAGATPRQGPQAPERLKASSDGRSDRSTSAPGLTIATLRKRSAFLRTANGLSERRRTLVIQSRPRGDGAPTVGAGFTATRKVGGAVIRNRARRRLREAVRKLLPIHARAGTDYVFIARQETPECPWQRLLDDMESALVSLARRLDAGEVTDSRSAARLQKPKA